MNAERVNLLIEKINSLRARISKGNPEIIDIDLMMDYTRVLYADLMELRKNLMFDTAGTEVKAVDDPVTLSKPDEENPVAEADIPVVIEKPYVMEQPAPPENPVHNENTEIKTDSPKDNNTPSEPLAAVKNAEKIVTPVMSRKVKDIRHFITINDRFLFMSELFKNDKFDYESALDIINNLSDYPGAERWIKENYFDNQLWDPENSTVTAFMNAIKSRFK